MPNYPTDEWLGNTQQSRYVGPINIVDPIATFGRCSLLFVRTLRGIARYRYLRVKTRRVDTGENVYVVFRFHERSLNIQLPPTQYLIKNLRKLEQDARNI